jgi:hypothetical protein
MTERKRIAGLAEQIELARKHLDEWPELVALKRALLWFEPHAGHSSHR